MPVKKDISFLPDQENINSFSARTIRWLTSVGRFVIVFTELIVICAFLSRFWLDRTNSDLSEIVRQQKAILDSTSDFEVEYAQLQKKLAVIKKFYANQPEYESKVATLVESTPEDVNFNSLLINHSAQSNEVTALITLSAYQESAIINFITNLIANPKITSVDIRTIEKKPNDTKYNVNLSLVFSKKS
ncbi:hypothetical protein HYV64_01440 [Candidatus Shapirobacteria bacterium]|nr:hypothetical protein [Candidatus Shapirobacteria bacterium]